MILQNIDELKENNYPVLIIGSGPAGLTLALELEKKNIKTVIIEAGGEEYDNKSQSFYKINTEGVALKIYQIVDFDNWWYQCDLGWLV